jgi:hypothetical protein
MPGFNYGGKGDGTSWSSESGSGPEPGGGSHGNGGNTSHNGNGSALSATEKEVKGFIKSSGPKGVLTNFYKKAIKINRFAEVFVTGISVEGVMIVSVKGLTATQATSIGLGGVVVGYQSEGVNYCIGDLKTGFPLKNVGGSKDLIGYTSASDMISGNIQDGDWHAMTDAEKKAKQDEKSRNEEKNSHAGDSSSPPPPGTAIPKNKIISMNGGEEKSKIEVINGVGQLVKEFPVNESSLQDGVSLAASINKDISIKVGEKYAKIAEDLESGIKGKKIKNSRDAEIKFNQIISGINKKISVKDKAAVLNWLRKIDADQITRNARVLGKAFSGIDWAIKGLSLKNAAVKGVESGDWKSFRNEVEAIILSAGASYGLAATLAFFSPLSLTSLPAIFVFSYLFGYITSLIDAKEAEKLESYISEI